MSFSGFFLCSLLPCSCSDFHSPKAPTATTINKKLFFGLFLSTAASFRLQFPSTLIHRVQSLSRSRAPISSPRMPAGGLDELLIGAYPPPMAQPRRVYEVWKGNNVRIIHPFVCCYPFCFPWILGIGWMSFSFYFLPRILHLLRSSV